MGLGNQNPLTTFESWLEEAKLSELNNPNAMTLATVGNDGRPSARMVLLKESGPEGFVFYTNLESRKCRQLGENSNAALLFHWKSLDRQVRIEGVVEPVSAAEADAYFATRPRASQIGAWASAQSQPMEGMVALEKQIAFYTAKFHIGPVPRPQFWSGLRLRPVEFEFWQQGTFRLHTRHLFTRTDEHSEDWTVQRLYP
jgi:pyridoxamine 5'-phosphate oxidase